MSINYSKFFSEKIKPLLHPDPARDWFTLFVLSILLLSGIIVWNAWAFDTVVNGGVINPTTISINPIFNKSSLDTIHTIFVNRAAENEKYTSGIYHFTDPSQ